MIEAIPDSTLLANLAANTVAKGARGIKGRFNTNGNDGTITRFGWKAQNKSLMIFAGEAYNVEQGVSNEVFPQERETIPGCTFKMAPEDTSHPEAATVLTGFSDTVHFANFMRNLAPPQPAAANDSTTRGYQLFNQIGCATCPHSLAHHGAVGQAGIQQQARAIVFGLGAASHGPRPRRRHQPGRCWHR